MLSVYSVVSVGRLKQVVGPELKSFTKTKGSNFVLF